MSFDLSYILLVEDDPDDIVLVRRSLTKSGWQQGLKVVNDGELAMEFLSTAKPLPSLVLLDLRLPRKSGIDVLKWLRAQPQLSSLPVVVLTHSEEGMDVERANTIGVTAYLNKPVMLDDLMRILQRPDVIAGSSGTHACPPSPPIH